MTLKPKYIPKEVELEQEIQTLYQSKLEARVYDTELSQTVEPSQFMVTGVLTFSATGSASVAKTIPITEPNDKTLHVNVGARSLLITAHVTDVTTTAVTITCQGVGGTTFSTSLTSGQVLVDYLIVGTNP